MKKTVRRRKEQEEKVLDTILEKNPIEAPQSLVKERLAQMMMDAKTHFLSRGVMLEQDSEDLQKLETELGTVAEKDVKKQLLLEAISQQESITVSDADAEAEIQKYAEQNNQSVEKIRADVQKQEDGMEHFKHNLLREKTLAFLLPPDTIKEEEKNKEE